jgi:hypothetical protein
MITTPDDDRFVYAAFGKYCSEHGISEDRRLGDMPLRVVSEVLDAAQKLKSQEQTR